MSTFIGGGGTFQSTTLPNALLEAARLLDFAETNRNAQNPTLPPKTNISTAVDFGTKSIAIAASIPAVFNPNASGQLTVDVTDYLGASHSYIAPGTNSSIKSTDIMSAFVEIAQMLSSAEKQITPIEDQPNNVQVTYDAETLAITVAANLPLDISGGENGAVLLFAVDYV